jgi:capsular exopolysaccharide synthesis family protein
MLAVVTSVLLGTLLAFFRDSLNTTVRTREQVEQQVGVPVLATMPPSVHLQYRRRQRQEHSLEIPLLLPQLPDPQRGEALRYLRTRLKHYNGRGVQALLLTSPEPVTETATMLVNLAIVAASVGERTLLVDSNLHQPTLHSLLHCAATPGLIDILADPEGWQKGVQPTHMDNLHVIPAGTIMPPPALVSLESSAFDTLLTRLRATYDWLLFAAPPVLSYTDAVVLSAKVDATCLVLTCDVSRLEVILEAKAALEAVQGKVIGAILTEKNT